MEDQDRLTPGLMTSNTRVAQSNALRLKVLAHRMWGSIRSFIASILRSLPLLRTLLRLPAERIHSLQEWVTMAEGGVPLNEAHSAPSYRVVQPPLPALAAEKPHSVDQRADQVCVREHYVYPELFLASIPEGRVLGPSGVVITPDNKIVEQAAWTGDGWLDRDRAIVSLSLPKPERLNGQYFTIATFDSEGYAHWVLDALPRLALLSYLPDTELKVIVSRTPTHWQKESLSLLGIDVNNLIALNDRYLQFEVLHLPSYIGQPGTSHPFACSWLREKFSPDLNAIGARRLYITRRLARRRVINESELEPILARYGFEVVEAEKLGFAEQVRLFSQAEVIVGAHGAGLTNVVFAPATATVLELFADTCIRAMYYQLASVIGQSYWYLTGAALPNRQHHDRGFDDMRISPEQFEQTLSRIFEN